MPRRPEVFVRPVSLAEGQRLQKVSRTSTDPVKLRRAIVVWASAQGQSVPDIAHLLDVSADYVRDVVHAFNERGFEALSAKWSGGAPRVIDESTRARICAIAGCDPRILRQPLSTWSLAKLCDYLVATVTSSGSAARRCAGSCVTAACPGRPPLRGKPPMIPSSPPQ